MAYPAPRSNAISEPASDGSTSTGPSLPRGCSRYAGSPASKGKQTESLITFVTDRPGHDLRYAIDWTRAATELDYRPTRDLESGLDETVAWYLVHEDWWRPLLAHR